MDVLFVFGAIPERLRRKVSERMGAVPYIMFPKGLSGCCADTKKEVFDLLRDQPGGCITELPNLTQPFMIMYPVEKIDLIFGTMRLRGDKVERDWL